MTTASRAAQRGITFLGLLFVAAVLGVLAVVGAQIVPTAIEYQAVLKAVRKASEGSTVGEVRNLFQRTADVDSITSIKAQDLEITKEGDKVVVAFEYTREIHLVGPAYLLMKYVGRSK